MGSRGTGIFSDDIACEIRAQYRELIANGKSSAAARKQILAGRKDAIDDSDDGPVIWLALAATQHQYGRLETRVKSKALRIINTGTDLARWEAEGDSNRIRRRKAVLARLRCKLESTLPETKTPKPRRRPFRDNFKWPVGEVIAYRLLSDRYVLFHIVDCRGSRTSGYTPIFTILNWVGKRIPDASRIKKLPLKKDPDPVFTRNDPYMICVNRPTEKELPTDRIEWLSIKRKPHSQKIDGGYYVSRWKAHLDKKLAADLGWK